MGDLLIQVMVPVVLTHGFRWLGRRVGPRRGALLLGLPTTSAVVLYGYGAERGPIEALGAAEASLLGLVAAAITPVVYARSSRSGWGLPGVPIASILGYLLVASLLGGLTGAGPGVAVGIASLGLALAVFLAIQGDDDLDGFGEERIEGGSDLRWRWGLLATRTAVPALMALGVRTLRDASGPAAAGLFLTFPATSLALLVTTQLESGPAAARRLARAMPPSAFGMAGFLSTFLGLVPTFGTLVATAIGYLVALAALGAVEACSFGQASPAWHDRFVRNLNALCRRALRRTERLIPTPPHSTLGGRFEPSRWWRDDRPHRSTRFAPLVEALAG
ncbi:MAG: hypothetical protein AB7I30_05405 [Isosphaeraceae bacterium]